MVAAKSLYNLRLDVLPSTKYGFSCGNNNSDAPSIVVEQPPCLSIFALFYLSLLAVVLRSFSREGHRAGRWPGPVSARPGLGLGPPCGLSLG